MLYPQIIRLFYELFDATTKLQGGKDNFADSTGETQNILEFIQLTAGLANTVCNPRMSKTVSIQ